MRLRRFNLHGEIKGSRGEIACRIFKTTKLLGIKSVAVFSDADRDSMHVKMADEAYHIGPSSSSESYLRADKIIEIAKRADCKAIHPGYGFLSENYKFAEMLRSTGITFIGPPPQAIRDMGSKSESKRIMIEAGVPVVPGYHGKDQSIECLKQEAQKIGFPVMIKAVMGGGGKGMRISRSLEDFEEMIESSKRESLKSFGDDNVILERYIERSRHVEVQVFGDSFGNVVYLYERDCSVQRRHQKILEEAPAVELRHALGLKAVAAAKAVKYVGAGTVEFIFDCDTNQFYFMEMNTRLQVEHPVTEMITKQDLVQWQIEVASGNPLPLKQEHIPLVGHAIEARLYAENPKNNFMPDTGRLLVYQMPTNDESARVETGVQQGSEVTVFYDPMIAKLVVCAHDRVAALLKLKTLLGQCKIMGVKTNVEFVLRVLDINEFKSGHVDTSLIKKNEAKLFPMATEKELDAFVAIAMLTACDELNEPDKFWKEISNQRFFYNFQRPIKLLVEDKAILGQIIRTGWTEYKVEYNIDNEEKRMLHISHVSSGNGNSISCNVNGRLYREIPFIKGTDCIELAIDGQSRTLRIQVRENTLESEVESQSEVVAPMPSRVSHYMVKEGDKVAKGTSLVVLEAMKMEHVLKSPIEGVIKHIYHKNGDLVSEKKKLLEIIPNA